MRDATDVPQDAAGVFTCTVLALDIVDQCGRQCLVHIVGRAHASDAPPRAVVGDANIARSAAISVLCVYVCARAQACCQQMRPVLLQQMARR
jgi:hypothetical protein